MRYVRCSEPTAGNKDITSSAFYVSTDLPEVVRPVGWELFLVLKFSVLSSIQGKTISRGEPFLGVPFMNCYTDTAVSKCWNRHCCHRVNVYIFHSFFCSLIRLESIYNVLMKVICSINNLAKIGTGVFFAREWHFGPFPSQLLLRCAFNYMRSLLK